MMLSVTFEKYISTTAKITLSGIAQAMMSVGLPSFRNMIRMMMASSAPMIIFWKIEVVIISI